MKWIYELFVSCFLYDIKQLHYCPVKVDKTFFEIIEIQSPTAIFKGATI